MKQVAAKDIDQIYTFRTTFEQNKVMHVCMVSEVRFWLC